MGYRPESRLKKDHLWAWNPNAKVLLSVTLGNVPRILYGRGTPPPFRARTTEPQNRSTMDSQGDRGSVGGLLEVCGNVIYMGFQTVILSQ